MKRIVLISCVSKKRTYPCQARELYISDWFKKALAYAEKILKADQIFILSAEHGVVSLEKIIVPYDKTLKKMPKIERLKWSQQIMDELKQHIDIEQDEVVFLAGEKYREFLEPQFKQVQTPLEGLKIGQQLKFFKERLQ